MLVAAEGYLPFHTRPSSRGNADHRDRCELEQSKDDKKALTLYQQRHGYIPGIELVSAYNPQRRVSYVYGMTTLPSTG